MIPASKTATASILLVDDDDVLRERLARSLRDRGYEVENAADAEKALRKVASRRFASAVIDLRMPGPDGLSLLSALRERDANIRAVVLTGYGTVASAVEAIRLGAWSYVPKPADADDVVHALVTQRPLVAQPTSPGPSPSLARAEWEHIQRVLQDRNGNISETARRLAIARRTLQLKLKRGPLGN
jgi:two-component system, response regulator RegA